MKLMPDVFTPRQTQQERGSKGEIIIDQQTAYVKKLSAEMVAWEVHIERIKLQAETVSPEKKFEHSVIIGALQLKRDEAAQKLRGISLASDHEWKELKSGTERIWGEVGHLLSVAIRKT